MQHDAILSALIGDIYDAALAPASWPATLAKIAEFTGGQAAGLLSKDSGSKLGNAHYHVGVEERYIRLYRETYWKFDPLTPLIFFAVGEVSSRIDYMPDDEFRDGRFYKEWAAPQGWIDAANVVLEKSATSFAILSIMRSAVSGMVDDEMRRRTALIAPHVRRATLIGKAIELKSAEAATLADAFDGIGAGVFMLDEQARIVHANAAGMTMLSGGDMLRASGGRIAATDAKTDQALRDVLTACENGDAELGAKGIAIPLPAPGGARFVAHLLPLTSGVRRRAGKAYDAVAALFVQQAALDTPSTPEVIAASYRLTPTELRVLLAIVEVGGAPEVAEALGVGETTVKTHLGRVYEKTGARRHADLVKIVAGFTSPLHA